MIERGRMRILLNCQTERLQWSFRYSEVLHETTHHQYNFLHEYNVLTSADCIISAYIILVYGDGIQWFVDGYRFYFTNETRLLIFKIYRKHLVSRMK